MRIVAGDLEDPRIVALLTAHMEAMRAITPAESVYALDLSGLKRPDIAFYAAWDGEALLGVGALRTLAPDHGEVKSMHTAAALRGRGVAGALLAHIMAEARARGMARLSLETGSSDAFAHVRRLYARHGFTPCTAFGDYAHDPHSAYMTLALSA
jgi:putative acetyltransferase